MQLTYSNSRAICLQDPSIMEGPTSGDPFQSSFRLARAPAPAPAVRPISLCCTPHFVLPRFAFLEAVALSIAGDPAAYVGTTGTAVRA